MASTRRTSPNDNNDVERDFDCNEPPEERFPLSTNRRLGFTGLLDMIKFDCKKCNTQNTLQSCNNYKVNKWKKGDLSNTKWMLS